MRVTLYARVGVETDPSIEEQFATLRAWAAAAGHEVVAEFSDANLTAVRSRDPRPGQDNAVRYGLRGLTDIVAAVSLDRLGRSLNRRQGAGGGRRSGPRRLGLSRTRHRRREEVRRSTGLRRATLRHQRAPGHAAKRRTRRSGRRT